VTSFGRRGEAPGELNFPVSVALAADSLWIGDTLNFRVQRLDLSNGIPLGQLGRLGDTSGDTPRLKGIAQDAAGHLWLTDGQLDRVTLYDPDGVFLMSIGRTGSDPGEFAFPAGVAAHPDGRIAVADSLNRRVQIFRILPKREGSTR
jgi:sugar lactone lactonase YvrE